MPSPDASNLSDQVSAQCALWRSNDGSLVIISGGQTGVDRAALDAAIRARIPCGGWCPRDRWAEDGRIDSRYPLRETESASLPVRTRLNVRDADGTLILTSDELTGGTRLAHETAIQLRKPVMVIDPDHLDSIASAAAWIRSNRIGVLNVAGPRESQLPGISAQAGRFLDQLIRQLVVGPTIDKSHHEARPLQSDP